MSIHAAHVPLHRLALLLVGSVAASLLLSGCGKTLGGYPNHVDQASLVAPGPKPEDNKGMYLQLIVKMQQQGAYYASLAHIDEYRQRFGSTPELRRLQADALRETGQLEEAGTIYQSLTGSPEAAGAWHGLGLVFAHKGQWAQSEQALLKASQLDPVNATYLSDLGYAHLCAGELDAAREPLATAAELAPDNDKVMANLALWAELSGDGMRADAIMDHAKFSSEKRAGVRDLAMQLRVHRNASVATTKADTTTSANANPANIAHNANPYDNADAVPANMLDRFSPTANNEARP